MKRAVVLFSLLILLAGCGDSAPEDAVVTAPSDGTDSLLASTVSTPVKFGPLEFKVTKPSGTGTIPAPDIDIEFFSGGTAFLSDLAGAPIGDTVGRVKSKTGDNGVGTISAVITVPPCPTPAANVTVTGTVLGTVGSASALWTGTITRTCPTTGP